MHRAESMGQRAERIGYSAGHRSMESAGGSNGLRDAENGIGHSALSRTI